MASLVSCFSYTTKSGKHWGYRFEIASEDGTRKWATKRGFSTKGDAAKAGRDAQTRYENRGSVITPSQMSYSDFLNEWIASLSGTHKETTISNYKKKIKYYINPYLGKYRLGSIKRSDIRSLLGTLYNNGLARNTITVVKGIVTASFTFAVEEHYLAESPAAGELPIPTQESFSPTRQEPHTKPHVFIPPDRITQIFERFPKGTPTHIALMLGYKCGLRIGETFALTWDDIDFQKGTINVGHQVQWYQNPNRSKDERENPNKRNTSGDSGFWYLSSPKYNSVREISIDPALIALLQSTSKR